MHVDVKTTCDCRLHYKPIFCVLHVGLINTSTEKEKNSAVHPGWAIADRYYERSPNRWIDVLNDVKANISRTTPSALRDRNISSAEIRMSVKPGKLMSADVIGDEQFGKTQSHYQKDEMQLWQTSQTRKMRHQDSVEGGPYVRLTLMSNKPPR